MKFDHFYHVYAAGEWRQPVQEHIQALIQSGLLEHLEHVYVGYVGPFDRIIEVEQFINGSIPTITVNKSEDGWEQETMGLIPHHLSDNHVLYAHTKGASKPSAHQDAWRRSMTKECIINWAHATSNLETHDIVGCHWIMAEDLKWYFGGTYWWATARYLQTLPKIGKINRYEAEHWVGLNPNVKAFDLKPGYPSDIPLTTDWRTA